MTLEAATDGDVSGLLHRGVPSRRSLLRWLLIAAVVAVAVAYAANAVLGAHNEGVFELDTKDVNDPQNPVGDSYSNKALATLRWMDPSSRVFAEYEFRWNGERKAFAEAQKK